MTELKNSLHDLLDMHEIRSNIAKEIVEVEGSLVGLTVECKDGTTAIINSVRETTVGLDVYAEDAEHGVNQYEIEIQELLKEIV